MATTGNILGTGVSALLAFQRALTTTGHNIANVNTEGYSRQRVELSSRPPQFIGVGFLGTGVEVTGVQRIYNQFIAGQVLSGRALQGELETVFQFSSQLDSTLGSPQLSLDNSLQSFFDALQTLSTDPASIGSRQVVLSEAEGLVNRFQILDRQLQELARGVNQEMTAEASEINALAQAIAKVNADIVAAQGMAGGGTPNDLLDQRDVLLNQLSEHVTVSTLPQQDGSVNVFIGSGQALVVGAQASTVSVSASAFDPTQLDVRIGTGAASVVVTDSITGGRLGGLLQFRDDVLQPAQNGLGRIAVAVADQMNAQHREGMDLDGNLGGDLFTVGAPQVFANTGNSGTGTVTVAINDVTALTGSDYQLNYDGANYSLVRLSDGTSQVLGAAGPFNVDGMTISIAGAPAAGDRFLLQPTRTAAAGMDVAIADPRKLAAAAPIRTETDLANQGTATISAGEVLDVTDPNLLDRLQIRFNNPPNTFDVIDVATSTTIAAGVAYTSGGNIDFNGHRVQISGNPAAGDSFYVDANTGGVGDNRNALLLAGLQQTGVLDGGSASFQAGYGQLVGKVATQTRQAEINRDAQTALLEQAEQLRESVSGVNLDEEAARLLQFEQAYQAAAQVLAVADTLFQTLLSAVGRG